jgi:hypothetical protein
MRLIQMALSEWSKGRIGSDLDVRRFGGDSHVRFCSVSSSHSCFSSRRSTLRVVFSVPVPSGCSSMENHVAALYNTTFPSALVDILKIERPFNYDVARVEHLSEAYGVAVLPKWGNRTFQSGDSIRVTLDNNYGFLLPLPSYERLESVHDDSGVVANNPTGSLYRFGGVRRFERTDVDGEVSWAFRTGAVPSPVEIQSTAFRQYAARRDQLEEVARKAVSDWLLCSYNVPDDLYRWSPSMSSPIPPVVRPSRELNPGSPHLPPSDTPSFSQFNLESYFEKEDDVGDMVMDDDDDGTLLQPALKRRRFSDV